MTSAIFSLQFGLSARIFCISSSRFARIGNYHSFACQYICAVLLVVHYDVATKGVNGLFGAEDTVHAA